MNLLRDGLRPGIRRISRSPGLAAAVVLTLCLGIAASAAVSSVVGSVLLGSLPLPDADRLAFVSRAYPGFPQGGGNFSYPALRDIERLNRSFDAFAAYQAYGALALTEGPEPVRVLVNWATPSYFRLLGVRPALGRVFRDEEDRYDDADAVVLLSHGFWQRQFGGEKGIVGRAVRLNGRPFTVVGVAPAEFRDGPAEQEFGQPVDAWIPLGLAHGVLGQFGPTDRSAAILWGIGRLKKGVGFARARADIDRVGKQLARMYPETDRGFGLVARPLKDQLVGELYAPIAVLGVGALFLLLIGCANAANLLTARTVARRRELAIRAAHGATAARLSAQAFGESLLLALAAGGAGLLLASWGVAAFSRTSAAGLPAGVRLAIDRATVGGALAVSIVSGLLIGALPALLASRTRVAESLAGGGRLTDPIARGPAMRILTGIEVGLAIVLLAVAGLLVRSLENLGSAELGFRTKDLLTLRLDLRGERYASEEARGLFARSLVAELGRVPGVASVTLWGPSMIGRATWVLESVPEGKAADDPANALMSWRHSVNPGALANLGIPLEAGRDFTWADDRNAPLVAIVSQSTARAQWPGQDPIGKRFRTLRLPGWFTVVGVAADARHRQRLDLTDAANGVPPSGLGPQRDVYLPYLQRPNPGLVVALRLSADPAGVSAAARAAVSKLDPALPLYDAALLEERLALQERGSRVLTALAAAYALIALFLASIGLFGVLAHGVERRTREIGIRRTLGALPADVVRTVVGMGLVPAAAGFCGGLAGAFLLAHRLTDLLFGVGPGDPIVFAGSAFVAAAAAAAAWSIPVARALAVDPVVCLRGE